MPIEVEKHFVELRWQVRNWQNEKISTLNSVAEVLVDPLTTRYKTRVLSKVQSNVEAPNNPDFVDPLGATMEDKADTSYGKIIIEKPGCQVKREPVLVNTLAAENEEYLVNETQLVGFEPWSWKRKTILESFEASEKLSITTSFLPNGMPFETHVSTLNRENQRVQQFEDKSGQKKYASLSQQEYVRALNELRQKLLVAWSRGERVESFMTMSDLARILASTSSPQFYPTQFVLVTDILDVFGNLVYERLLAKANEERKKMKLCELGNEFVLDDVPPEAQNIARNWFRKVGSLKELLPRFYVESSIIGCMRFVDPKAIPANFLRLCEFPNHIPQPLAATYARVYICRVIMRLLPDDRAPHWKCLNDWISLSVAIPQTSLLTPALEWLIQCTSFRAVAYEDMLPVWNFCRLSEKRSLLLKPFISSVPITYLCEHSVRFCELILQDDQLLSEEMCVFGRRLMKGETPESARRTLLRAIWQRILKFTSIKEFVESAVVWIGFAALYFQLNTVDVMIAVLIKKLSLSKQCDQYSVNITQLVESLLCNRINVIELLSTKCFIQLLDFILEENSRSKCSESVLAAFIIEHRMGSCENFCVAYQVLALCKRLHDSLSVAADESDINFVSDLIKRSLDRFDLDKEPERALNFYVDSRAALSNNDIVIAYLVTRICNLGYTLIGMGRISRTGASFLRACIANAFITIASIVDVTSRLHLYLQCGFLGLMANALPQVDATVKCCIELLADSSELSPVKFRSIASAFLAFLVLVPDSLNKRPLYAFNAFLTAITRYNWNGHCLEHGRLLVQSLHYLATMRLTTLPYHIESLQSNDTIYGSGKEFVNIITEKEAIVVERLEEVLHSSERQRHVLSMELLELIVSIGAIEELAPTVQQLWQNVVGKKDLCRRRSVLYTELKGYLSENKISRRLLKTINALEQ